MKRLLAGKCVFLTGGSRGLGRAMCRRFAEEGARVAFTYTRGEETAAETADGHPGNGREGKGFRVSAIDADKTAEVVHEVEALWGGLDILVNNAGASQNLPLALLEEEDFDKVMDINVKGTFLTSRVVLRGMIRRKAGVILNIGSLAGERMIEAPIHYCASKAAIRGLTQAMAKEAARHGVRVLCLAPGLLEDGLGKNLPEHRLADYLRHCALGRVRPLRLRSRASRPSSSRIAIRT